MSAPREHTSLENASLQLDSVTTRAINALDSISDEIDLHRRFGGRYGYEFFVLRRS